MNRAGTTAGPNPAAKPATGECERFYADLERAHLAPLWRLDTVQPEPRSPVQPYLWKWREFYPHLLRAGDVMQLAETQAGEAPERRVLLFVNPGISTLKAATETLSVGVQLIFPGEVAPAHRHTIAAIRLMLQGRGAYTIVDGEKLSMEPGDLILTPNGSWHDHGNESDEPIVWMDGLDRQFVKNLSAIFFEPYPDGKQQVGDQGDDAADARSQTSVRPAWERPAPSLGDSSQHRYAWRATKAELRRLAERNEPNPYNEVALTYINPASGGHVLSTMGCAAQLLPPGTRTKARRHTGSAVCTVLEGSGYSILNGERLAWEKGDVFVIPPWAWYEHGNDATSDDAYLFNLNDLPVLQAMGLFREEPYEGNGGHQTVQREAPAAVERG